LGAGFLTAAPIALHHRSATSPLLSPTAAPCPGGPRTDLRRPSWSGPPLPRSW